MAWAWGRRVALAVAVRAGRERGGSGTRVALTSGWGTACRGRWVAGLRRRRTRSCGWVRGAEAGGRGHAAALGGCLGAGTREAGPRARHQRGRAHRYRWHHRRRRHCPVRSVPHRPRGRQRWRRRVSHWEGQRRQVPEAPEAVGRRPGPTRRRWAMTAQGLASQRQRQGQGQQGLVVRGRAGPARRSPRTRVRQPR